MSQADLLRGWKGSEKAPEASPAVLEAESRNRRPPRQRLLMARLVSASPQEATLSWQRGPSLPPGAVGCINYSAASGLILPSWFS